MHPPDGKIHVLAIDDEPLLLELLVSYLEDLGYAVVAQSGVTETWACLLSDVKVDLLITDVNMPGMDGFEFARSIRVAQPLLPVVFVSGYMANLDRCPVPHAVLLKKPYSRQQLARGINDAMMQSAS